MNIKTVAIGIGAAIVGTAGLYIYEKIQQERMIKRGLKDTAMYIKGMVDHEQQKAERYYRNHTCKQRESENLIKEV